MSAPSPPPASSAEPVPAAPAVTGAAGPASTGAAALEARCDRLLDALVAHQRARVLAEARRIDPRLTADDVLQPDDCPALAGDPRWNYEDGVLAGLLAAQIALRAELRKENLPGRAI